MAGDLRSAVYCFDTSAFIHGWERIYMPKAFPSVWAQIDNLISARRIISPDEVLDELRKKQGGDLCEWMERDNRRHVFQPVDDGDVQDVLTEILADFPRLVAVNRTRGWADPWVVAVAEVRGAVVVTQEVENEKAKSPKIPNVCKARGVPCTNLPSVIINEGWEF